MNTFYAFLVLALAGVCSSDEAKGSNDAYARLLVSKQVRYPGGLSIHQYTNLMVVD